MKKTKEQLFEAMRKARAAYEAVEYAERDAENKKLIGKCFKYRNSYSAPEKPSDRWWLYVKVISTSSRGLRCFQFQTDKYGKIEIEPKTWHISMGTYTPIPASEFDRAWKRTVAKVRALCTAQN